ncbi:hypothetical protein K488DRAFT_29372, partial [Vararia minispora EC-137]
MLRCSNLKGFRIPGAAEDLVVTLFADDTTVYLNQADSFEDLRVILDKWCAVSGAFFNVSKTEIIPLGDEDYRDRLADKRRLDAFVEDDDSPQPKIPDYIPIHRDGRAARSLGAWAGNRIAEAAVWTPVVEKINSRFNRYEKQNRYPDLASRKHAINQFIRQTTEYKTMAQGMPEHVTKTLTKIISRYTWGGSERPTVNRATLELRRDEGGLGIVNLEVRNEAIAVMKL